MLGPENSLNTTSPTRPKGKRGPFRKCEMNPPENDLCGRLLDLLCNRHLSLTNISEHFLAVDRVKVLFSFHSTYLLCIPLGDCVKKLGEMAICHF